MKKISPFVICSIIVFAAIFGIPFLDSNASSGTAVDATNFVYNTSCGSCTISLTTTNAGDLAILFVSWSCSPSACGAGYVVSVSDAQFSLTWSLRQENCNSGAIICTLEYTAQAGSSQTFSSDTIAVSSLTGASVGIVVIAISDAVSIGGTVFDSGWKRSAACSVSCTTVSAASATSTNANEILIYATATCTAADGTQTPDAFYTTNIDYSSSCQHTNTGNYLYLGVAYLQATSTHTHVSSMTSALSDYLGILTDGVYADFPTTITETGLNFPNGTSMNAGFEFILAIMIPVGLMLWVPLTMKSKEAYVFILLIGLTIGSVIGVLMKFVPYSLIFVFGGFLAIYLWKGRSNGAQTGGPVS